MDKYEKAKMLIRKHQDCLNLSASARTTGKIIAKVSGCNNLPKNRRFWRKSIERFKMFEKEIALCKEISELSGFLEQLAEGWAITANVQVCDLDLRDLYGASSMQSILGIDYYETLIKKINEFKQDVSEYTETQVRNIIDVKLTELRGPID